MSWNPCLDPTCPTGDAVDAIETLIVPRARDLGDFEVRRALPAPQRQMVGPFIFFDQAGPAEFVTGQGVDVRPHPHIGLATVTYLFRGEFQHRDSLGSDQIIHPGAVNWMIAGSGVTHSERTSAATRQHPHSLFGIQTWVALPEAAEDGAAGFEHAARETLPVLDAEGATARLILGTAWGERAPVRTFNEMFYADVELAPGARVPLPDGHEDRGLYIVSGSLAIAGAALRGGADDDLSAGRPAAPDSRAGGGAADAARRRDDARAALHLVELRRVLARADRGRQGGLAGGRLGARPLPAAAGGRGRVHPAAAGGGGRTAARGQAALTSANDGDDEAVPALGADGLQRGGVEPRLGRQPVEERAGAGRRRLRRSPDR